MYLATSSSASEYLQNEGHGTSGVGVGTKCTKQCFHQELLRSRRSRVATSVRHRDGRKRGGKPGLSIWPSDRAA
jgi:hypothetical protein